MVVAVGAAVPGLLGGVSDEGEDSADHGEGEEEATGGGGPRS